MRSLVRPQQRAVVEEAIAQIRAAGIPTLNLDLIYGIAGQTVASFLTSIDSALAFQPEELYLYPLYVRPHTGLDRIGSKEAGKRSFVIHPESVDNRLALYEAGRERLLAAGYEQVSMRMFRAASAPDSGGPAYCCQSDGMVGIGCGARSYTSGLHYSSEYGVSRRSVADILAHYLERDEASFAHIGYGVRLDEDERRRRFVIQSLLAQPGLDLAQYRERFGTECFDDLPQLDQLFEQGLATREDALVALNEAGLARADTIGPWLISAGVAERMRDYQLD